MPCPWAAADPRRSGFGQDHGDHPAHRLAHRGRGRAPGFHPRHDLHQQGRRGDAGAGAAAGLRARGADVGKHLPQLLHPHPAPRGRAHARGPGLRHLRPGRPEKPHQAGAGGAEAAGEAVPPEEAAGAHRRFQEPVPAAGRGPGGGPGSMDTEGAGGLRSLPEGPEEPPGLRLRRPAALDRAPVPRPRDAVDLRRAVQVHPGGRVPGHQPRPVPAGAAPGPAAPQSLRRR